MDSKPSEDVNGVAAADLPAQVPTITVSKGKSRAIERADTDLGALADELDAACLSADEDEHGEGSSRGRGAIAGSSRAPSTQRSRSRAIRVPDDHHDANDDLSTISYELKPITFNGTPHRIVCQTTNGACPILSIANFLVLTSAITLPSRAHISASSLTDVLADYLLGRQADLSALDMLPGLHRGLNVDPGFGGVDGFAEGDGVMRAFGCELVHTWVPTAGVDPAYDALVGQYDTFDKAQMQVLLHPEEEVSLKIAHFFDTYPMNTTPAGVQQLQEKMRECEMCILFLNAHFSLVYKHPVSGDLYTLVTDAGYVSSRDEVVWESLEAGKTTQLFSADFIPRTVLGEGLREDVFGRRGDTRQGGAGGGGGGDNSVIDPEHSADAQLARDLQREEDERAASRLSAHHARSATAAASSARHEAPMEGESDGDYARRIQEAEDAWAAAGQGQGQRREQGADRMNDGVNRSRNDKRRAGNSAKQKDSSKAGKKDKCVVM
ncbi:hypothetical protein PYCC9005_002549 [Savitreella phatthalungensis]